MPKAFLIGKVDNFSVSMNWSKRRGIVRAKTENVRFAPIGVKLENLAPGPNYFFPAMMLTHAEWKHHYFVMEREGWTEQDYFNHAERLMAKLGIIEP